MRNEIDQKLVSVAYNISKKVFEEALSLKAGQNELVIVGINSNSAKDFIENFRHLMNGEEYQRTLSTFGTTYFFRKYL